MTSKGNRKSCRVNDEKNGEKDIEKKNDEKKSERKNDEKKKNSVLTTSSPKNLDESKPYIKKRISIQKEKIFNKHPGLTSEEIEQKAKEYVDQKLQKYRENRRKRYEEKKNERKKMEKFISNLKSLVLEFTKNKKMTREEFLKSFTDMSVS
jgi:hypothetical protein